MIEITDKAVEMLAEAVSKEGDNPHVRLYQAGIG